MNNLKLTIGEKQKIKNNLIKYIKEDPIPESIFLTIIPMYKLFTKPLVAMLSFVIVASGGTALAAENSVPGDLLYGVKINVNEKARELLTFTKNSKTNLSMELLEERLVEAEKLAEREELTEEKEGYLENEYDELLAEINGDISEIEEAVLAQEMTQKLEEKLKKRSEKLAELNMKTLENLSEKLAKELEDDDDDDSDDSSDDVSDDSTDDLNDDSEDSTNDDSTDDLNDDSEDDSSDNVSDDDQSDDQSDEDESIDNLDDDENEDSSDDSEDSAEITS